MKKKKFLTWVATGLMACLVAAMGGMTYSKYITSTKTGDQQATAAKWGFVMTANTENLFGKMYDGATIVTEDTTDGVSVKASSDKFIVAPGTSGSMTIAINGTAEVKAQLSLKASGTDALSEICLKNYNGSAVNYYPITWTLKNGGTQLAKGTLATVLDKLDDTDETVIKANESYAMNYELSWEWPLETSDTNNIYDTIIGYKSYGRTWSEIGGKYVGDLKDTEYTADNIITGISFNIDVKIEQIQ